MPHLPCENSAWFLPCLTINEAKRSFNILIVSLNEMRHTITLNEDAYVKLKNRGRFGESYSELILRLVNSATRSNRTEGVASQGGTASR